MTTQLPPTLFESLYQIFHPLPHLLSGDHYLNIQPTSMNDTSETSGEFLNLLLTSIFQAGDAVVVHPDALSTHSLFSSQEEVRTEGIFDLLEYLDEIRKSMHQDESSSYELDKPIIAVVNTSGSDAMSYMVSPTDTKGSHWLSINLTSQFQRLTS